MTPHPQADLLRAIANGEQMQQEIPSGFSDCHGDKALNIIAAGWGHTIRIKPKPMTEAEKAGWNRKIRDSVDSMLKQCGYQEDASIRHQLSMMNFDVGGTA